MGERAFLEKQMTFGKYKCVLRKIDGRYDSLWQCLSGLCRLLVSEKIRGALKRLGMEYMTLAFFGEALLLVTQGISGIEMPSAENSSYAVSPIYLQLRREQGKKTMQKWDKASQGLDIGIVKTVLL